VTEEVVLDKAVVAVVVRTKDRPDLLRRALEDIAGQTTTQWECVVVNDGGDPAAVEKVLAAADGVHAERTRAVHHDEARGRWISANAGVLASAAPLIVLHDDDDSWHPEFLERSIAHLHAHGEAVGIVSRIEILWEKRTDRGYEVTGREMFQPHLSAPTLADTLLYNRFVPIAFVYRRRLHAEFGLYDDRLPVVGDWAFNLKVLSRYPLEFLGNQPYAYWRQRVDAAGAEGNSVIEGREEHARIDALLRDEALRDYVNENGLGLVLYLTKFIDRRLVDVESGIRSEIASSFWRRLPQAVLRRVRRFRR
jgi:glycosyltransferase involved in cell wall biosynthesis